MQNEQGRSLEEGDRPTDERCNTDSDCKCGSCCEGVCESDCLAGETCIQSYDNPQQLMCCKKENSMNGMCCAVIFNGQCCTTVGTCCPPEKPLRDKDGKCYACDDRSAIVYVTGQESNCSVCPDRFINRYSICVLRCSVDKPLMRFTGESCHECDDPNPIDIGSQNLSECSDICPNRFNSYADNYCFIKCSGDTPLRGRDGKCHGCDYEDMAPLGYQDGQKCTEICPNRIAQGNYCVLK